MENVIQELIKIENHAKDITRETEEKRKNIDALIESHIKEIQKQIDEKIAEQVRKINQNMIKESEIKLQQIKEDSQKQRNLLNEEYENNHIKIEKELFDFIIGR